MAQFYRTLFERRLITKRLKLEQVTDLQSLVKSISTYTKKYDPKNAIVLYRLPKSELSMVAITPCPVEPSRGETPSFMLSSDANKAIMTSAK